MSELLPSLTEEHIDFIRRQHLFFVGTAGAEGKLNISPKGMDTLRVRDTNRLAWLNLTGSGNETAAHVAENGRMTIMFCSFERQPLILRLYGTATVIHPKDANWRECLGLFPEMPGARQVFDLAINLVQTSCGFAVPRFEMVEERGTLEKWTSGKGEDGLAEYWATRNQLSLDGKPTGILGP